ncbi:MAG: hypothetical protein ACSLFK_08775 [Gemmatimonadaceae bacterium]
MTGRGLWWRVAAAVFAVGNAASAVYHVAIGEIGPATVHAGLAVGTLVFWQSVFQRKSKPDYSADSQQVDSRLDNLQHSLDAIAVEVERLGEGQRFAQKILAGRTNDALSPRDGTTALK